MVVLQAVDITSAFTSFGPVWAPTLTFIWVLWEVYCPIPTHQTAFQSFRDDLTARMDRHEIGQISLAEQVDGADAEKYRKIHDKERLTTTDFLEDTKSED